MRKIKFWLLMAVFTLLVLADGALTYINTPDLALEGNPLVSIFGLGWEALAIANLLVFILIFTAAYYSYFKYKTVYTDQTKFTAYFSQITFDRPDMFWKSAFLFPKHITPYIAGFGYSTLYAAVANRLILVLEWIIYTLRWGYKSWMRAYYTFSEKYCFGRFDLLVAAIVIFAFFFYWFYQEFKKQLDSQSPEKQ